MKLEVGMYVRTDEGKITKIIEIDKDGFKRVDKCIDFTNYNITKVSHNIIDLIEVGDYVNGYKIIKISTDHCGRTILIYGYDNGDKQVAITIYEEDIKSIVTKEQFSQMEYRLGD